MPPKRRTPQATMNAIQRGGSVTKTTTRIYGPNNLYKDLGAARARVSSLQRTVRALKDVIVFKAVNTERTLPSAGTLSSRSTLRPTPIDTKNTESIIALMEAALTTLDSRLLNIGTRVKTSLDKINTRGGYSLAQRQALQAKVLAQARREKLQIKRKFADINQKLASRRAELSRMRTAPLV